LNSKLSLADNLGSRFSGELDKFNEQLIKATERNVKLQLENGELIKQLESRPEKKQIEDYDDD
jgi:regulator of replication initiation timing